MKKAFYAFLITLGILLFAAACGEETGNLDINGIPKSRLVCAGVYYNISAELDANPVSCQWSVSDENVARISSGGKLYVRTVKKLTSFTLTAHHKKSGLTASVTLTAVPNTEKIRILTEDSSRVSGTLNVDITRVPGKITLSGAVTPEYDGVILFWQSSDESIAEVSATGVVSVKKPGSAVITVNTLNGKTASVTVNGCYLPQKLTLTAPVEMEIKKNAKIECEIQPDIAKGSLLLYESSAPDILSVDKNGSLRALRAGTAEITVRAENGVSESVTIECFKPVTGVYIEKSLTMYAGETKKLTASVKPADAKYNTLTYTSKAPHIAQVDNEGNVTGISGGKTTIIVSSSNGYTAEKSVTVNYIPLKEICQSQYHITLSPGAEYIFAVEAKPEDASDRRIIFESTDPSVAAVDENGKITAIKAGRTQIIARQKSGDCAPAKLYLRVLSGENALPLEGVVIGINPGHQITRDFTQLPLAPGSTKTKNANNGYAIGTKTGNKEYEITLQVSLLLKSELEALGAEVVMTRTENDVKINNIARAEMLNAENCDVALQIHCNSSDDKKKTGFLTYSKIKDSVSLEIAECITESVKEIAGTSKNKNHQSNNYMSLNWSTTPSILVELGYMSNPDEDVKLATAEYQLLLAKGIAAGLMEYFGS